MFQIYRALLGSLLAVCVLAGSASAASAATVYEFSPSGPSYQVNGDGLLANITTSSPLIITSVAQRTLSTTSVGMRFMVYDITNDTLLYLSPEKTFPSDSGIPSFKRSDDFPAITLQAGNNYAIGMMTNQLQRLYYQTAEPPVQNGITNRGWANTSGYVNGVPIIPQPAGFSVSLQLSYDVPPVSVPTLSEWSLILMGVLLVGGAAFVIQRRQSMAA